jgi:hypothetical protein
MHDIQESSLLQPGEDLTGSIPKEAKAALVYYKNCALRNRRYIFWY